MRQFRLSGQNWSPSPTRPLGFMFRPGCPCPYSELFGPTPGPDTAASRAGAFSHLGFSSESISADLLLHPCLPHRGPAGEEDDGTSSRHHHPQPGDSNLNPSSLDRRPISKPPSNFRAVAAAAVSPSPHWYGRVIWPGFG